MVLSTTVELDVAVAGKSTHGGLWFNLMAGAPYPSKSPPPQLALLEQVRATAIPTGRA